MKEIEVKKVIICNFEKRGTGDEISPIRRITTIYDFKGNPIAKSDELSFTIEQIADFVKSVILPDKPDILKKMVEYFIK